MAADARAFFGVADTSFVTVIANPAEAANWASELDRLESQLAAARQTLQTVTDLRSYAGDPVAAVAAAAGLKEVTAAVGALSSGAQTDADLVQAWQQMGTAQKLDGAAALLQNSGAGASMELFGQRQPRNASLYTGLARDAAASAQMRGQIAAEQAARQSVTGELALAWTRFKSATTESGKQAVLAEISQLQAQDHALDARRRAMLDDLELSDRQANVETGVRSRAMDEQKLAESALLNADARGRAQAADAQRMATLQRTPPAPPIPDYSAVKLWTTADALGGAQ
jgi:hypothetical protein